MADLGEGSSGAAGKRRRGPVPRPRGEPDVPIPISRTRTIRYAAAEVRPDRDADPVPEEERDLRTHTLLQFAEGTEEFTRCERYVEMDHLQHRSIDWRLVRQLGQRDRLEELLAGRWRRVLACNWPQYMELTVEFHSTFRHTAGSFTAPSAVSFSLGRQVYELSIPQFAVATGFYTEAETRQEAFTSSLRGVFRKPHDQGVTEAQLATFWMTIADGAYSSSVVESSIRDPVIRYLHRIIACTLIGRKAGAEKCSQLDLFCLYCIVGRHEANVATVLLSSLARPRRGGPSARLDLGPYIAQIAAHLGVFDRYPRYHLTAGPPVEGYGLQEMRQAGMCPFDEPPRWEPVRQFAQVPPPAGTPAAEAMQMGVPTARQRVLFRSERPQGMHPLREQRPVPVTLEALRDQLFDRMDRQDRAIRDLMIHQGMEIPGYFRDPPAPDTDQGDDE